MNNTEETNTEESSLLLPKIRQNSEDVTKPLTIINNIEDNNKENIVADFEFWVNPVPEIYVVNGHSVHLLNNTVNNNDKNNEIKNDVNDNDENIDINNDLLISISPSSRSTSSTSTSTATSTCSTPLSSMPLSINYPTAQDCKQSVINRIFKYIKR